MLYLLLLQVLMTCSFYILLSGLGVLLLLQLLRLRFPITGSVFRSTGSLEVSCSSSRPLFYCRSLWLVASIAIRVRGIVCFVSSVTQTVWHLFCYITFLFLFLKRSSQATKTRTRLKKISFSQRSELDMYEFTHGRGINTLRWELSSSSDIYVSNIEIYSDSNVPELLLQYE